MTDPIDDAAHTADPAADTTPDAPAAAAPMAAAPVVAAAAAAPAPAPAPAAAAAPPTAAAADRPTGITILAVLAGVGGILLAVWGIIVFVGGTVVFGGLGALLGLAFLAVAALYLAFCVAALQLKPWGWPLGVVGAAASAILAVLQLLTGDLSQVVSLAISGGILYYLNQPGIKAAFGRA
jgi:hypothetical protein